MAQLFNSLRDGAPLGTDLNSAYISVIPKLGKDASEVGNYHPISRINNDIKIMTKIFANRVASFICSYIHRDQVGFIPGRQGPDQIRRTIDIISLLKSQWDGGPPQKDFLLSIDLHKAFDSVDWAYLSDVLERWGFGPYLLNIIHSLYSTPIAIGSLMGRYSDSHSIGKGTRQGCPLSPLLFAMAIETLAIAIRSNPDIKGVICGEQQYKCALYTDDFLLYITSPLKSTPVVYKILRDFSEVTGLQVNMNKSTALNISVPLDLLKQLSRNFAFSWAPTAIPYLGIKLTPDINNLFTANYPPMIHKSRGDMGRWSKCGLS